MKIQLILKTAIVAMAAFGAYAFGGNGNQQDPFKQYRLNEQGDCTDLVEARCSETGTNNCKIVKSGQPLTLFDIECLQSIKHRNEETVDWR